MDRVSHIAPFLNYDPDPYIVVNNGELVVDCRFLCDESVLSERTESMSMIRRA